MAFTGKTIWITGASSGLGAALARQFARQGAALVLSARQTDKLALMAAALRPAPCLILAFEATDLDALPDIVERAWGWRGGIDLLVNNAGISQRSRALETEIATYRRLMEVDFFAPVALTQIVAPKMVAQGFGHIATVSSVAGRVGAPKRSGYSAAKHAVEGYFAVLRAELAASGVNISLIVPGYIRTDIAKNALSGDGSVRGKSDADADHGMDVDQAAAIILRGLARQKPDIALGGWLEMTALALKRLWPGLLYRITARLAAKDG